MNNITVLLTHQNVPSLKDAKSIAQEFKGMVAYTVKGTTNAASIQHLREQYMPDLKIIYLASSPEVLERIANDPKGFTYLDFTFYNDALARRLPIKRHPVSDNINEEFAIIMPLNSDWPPLINEYFRLYGSIMQNPDCKKSLTKYLGVNAARMLESVAKKNN